MGIYLNPKATGFQESVNSQIYVDKTGLISYTNSVVGTRQKFICVSRPRRFGKSMAAEMLAAYYCNSCDSRELFQPFQIAQDASYEKHLNQYNVVFINMQSFLSQAANMDAMLQDLQEAILDDLKQAYKDIISAEETKLIRALSRIFAETDLAFVFIIDEWDCIFREKKNDTAAQTKYLDFLRLLLKDMPYVKLAYMTGILPIKKYGTHSALNMFTEFSMTEPKGLAAYIGFTEPEVNALCKTYKMNFDEAKRWYDGYRFKNDLHIYSPKSMVDAMLNQEFNSYWTRTETYEALKVYIDMNFDGLRETIVELLGGGKCSINPAIFSNDMTTFRTKDDVLTLLTHLGYLTYNIDTKEVSIPNEEVRGEFFNAISVSGWEEVMKAINASQKLLEHTWHMDSDAVAKGLDTVHQDTTSILQYNDENSLSCVISLAY